MKYNDIQECSQPIGGRLHDTDDRGKERDWRGKKVANEYLAAAYESIDKVKAARLRECCKVLTFRQYNDGTRKLDTMSSCRVRLCPLCSWRRSLKVFAQTSEIVTYAAKNYKLHYIMLTLTVKSCTAEELSGQITQMMRGWQRLIERVDVACLFKDGRTKKPCGGWYRSLEITHDCYPTITPEMYYGDASKHVYSRQEFYTSHGLSVGDPNPSFDSYHPHFHVLLAVRPSYFTSRNYIAAAKWAELWEQALRLDYTPVIDVRKVHGSTVSDLNKAVAEVAKYACKDADYIIPSDWDMTVATVKTLDAALSNRRLIAYGGLLRDIKSILHQDDVENGDLVHVDGEDKLPEEEYKLVYFWWWSGYRDYYAGESS